MTQVAEKHQPWTSALEERPTADRAGCRSSGTAARRVSRSSDSRPSATRSGGSRTWRRLPARSCRRRPRSTTRRGQPARRVPVRRRAAAAGVRERPLRAGAVAHAGLPAGVRVGSLAPAIASDRRRRRALSRPARRLRHARVHGAEHRVRGRRRVRLGPGRRGARRAAAAAVRVVDAAGLSAPGDDVDTSADADRARREQPGPDRRDVRRPARPDVLHERGHRGCRRRERRARSLQGAGGERRRVPHREHARPRGAQRELLVALVLARRRSWCGTTRSPRSPARAPSAR